MRDDQDRAVDLRVDVDQQLGQVGGADRSRPIRLVAEDDLRVEHQRLGQAGGALRIPPEISRGTCSRPPQTHQVELLMTMSRISLSFFLCSRNGNAVLS